MKGSRLLIVFLIGSLQLLVINVDSSEAATFIKSDRKGRDVFPSRRAYVETREGALQGKISKSRKGQTFYEFLGIPYGTVAERFQESEPSIGWEGLRDATKYSPVCFQIEEYTKVVSGVEDCLFINVFTPQIPLNTNTSEKKLPVIFAIHEGGFSQGDVKTLRPDYLMDHNVVLVTANYRLGPFGFLNAGVSSAKGNQGLKDLVLALKWVQANIEEFGGDSSRVVLNGGSNAAYAVSFLTLSPLAKGLFSGAISQSGSALCPWTQQTRPGLALKNAQKLASAVDCPSSSPSYLVKCLQKIDAAMLVAPTVPVDPLYFDVGNAWFGPSIEEEGSDGAFLTHEPLEILKAGNFNHVPYIIGANAYEGSFFEAVLLPNDTALSRLNNEWGRVAPNTFMYEDFAQDPCRVSSAIRDFYFKGQPITKSDGEALSAVYADRGTLQCVRDAAILHSAYAPVYLYNLTRPGLHSINDLYKARDQNISSPGHADEMQYLFPCENFPYIHSNSSDFGFSETLLQFWASFAAEGKPNCANCTGQNWSPLNVTDESRPLEWYELNDTPAFRSEDPELTSRMDFWRSLDLKGVISSVKSNESKEMREPELLSPPRQVPEKLVEPYYSNIETNQSPVSSTPRITLPTITSTTTSPTTTTTITTTTPSSTSEIVTEFTHSSRLPTTRVTSSAPELVSTTSTTSQPTTTWTSMSPLLNRDREGKALSTVQNLEFQKSQPDNSSDSFNTRPNLPYNVTTALNFTIALKFSIVPNQNGTSIVYERS